MSKKSPKKGTKRSERLNKVKEENEPIDSPATRRFYEIKAKQQQRIVEENKKIAQEKKIVAEENKRRAAIREHPIYKEINGKLQETLEKYGKLRTYRLKTLSAQELEELMDSVNKARDEFFAKEDGENVGVWQKRNEDLQRQNWNREFPTQRVICTTQRSIRSKLDTDYLLVKFGDEFPRASFSRMDWVNLKDQEAFEIRQLRLDLVEFNIRHSRTNQYFKDNFPNRYAELEENMRKGEENYADKYIYSDINRYKVFLMKMEEYFNAINEKYGLPPVFIEDWTANTDWKEAFQALKDLLYIQSNIISDKVQALIDHHKYDLAHIKCTESCKNAVSQGIDGCIDSKQPRRLCCGKKTSMELDEDGRPIWKDGIEGKKPDSEDPECQVNIECTCACECYETCGNHRMQYGRQHPLLIFRSPEVGWTVRALTEIGEKELVGEYTGTLFTERSPQDNGRNYDFPIAHSTTDKDGNECAITVAGFKAGNETRFFSHGCNPTIYPECFVTERHGIFYSRVGFVTEHQLSIGDELSFDYFNKRRALNIVDVESMFDDCKCHSDACRFTKDQIKAARELEAEVKKENDELDELEDTIQEEKKQEHEQKRKENFLFQFEFDKKHVAASINNGGVLSGRKKRQSTSTDSNRVSTGASTSGSKGTARSGSAQLDSENSDRADPSHSGSTSFHREAKKRKEETSPSKGNPETGNDEKKSTNEKRMNELAPTMMRRMSSSSTSREKRVSRKSSQPED